MHTGMDPRATPEEIDLWETVSSDLALQQRLAAASSSEEVLQALRSANLDPGSAAKACAACANSWDGPPRVVREKAPPAQWLPVQLFEDEHGLRVEWHHFGSTRLIEPFFEQSWAKVAALPAQSLLRVQTPVDALLELASGPSPDGLIFHMSRCGSTLVAQMLADLEHVTVLAEPPAFDAVLRMHRAGRLSAEHLRGAAAALMRKRHAEARQAVFKLDAWHTPSWPILARLFPETPAIFLHRDPTEVLVSQEHRPGLHAIPGQLPLSLYGFASEDRVAEADHAAWAIAQIAEAGLEAVSQNYATPVDYADLPDALITKILPRFGIVLDDHERERLVLAGNRYSKDPTRSFQPDTDEKRGAASSELRARIVAFGLDRIYARLVEPGNRPHAPQGNPKATVRVSYRFD